jgi:hypothetical protein
MDRVSVVVDEGTGTGAQAGSLEERYLRHANEAVRLA